MSMKDWNDYRRQLVAGVRDLAKLTPDMVRGYTALRDAGAKTGHLDAKTRELIALALQLRVATAASRSMRRRRASSAPGELAEALGVAVSINAGAAVLHPYIRCVQVAGESLNCAGNGMTSQRNLLVASTRPRRRRPVTPALHRGHHVGRCDSHLNIWL
jgi:alkylhydroperoxidase/carboxymuconolactone decarboxylase family protein YurZ